jgi:hypothetical protein
MDTQICLKCKEEKNINENFGKYIDKRNDKERIRKECKSCRVEREKNRIKDTEKHKESNRKYKANNKEKIKEYEKIRTSSEEFQQYRRIRDKKKRDEDIQFRLRALISSRIRSALKCNKKITTIELLDCSVIELKKWLEYQFDENMSWDNHGIYWHMDHVIPFTFFDLTSIKQQHLACNWTNIQPLECKENISKSNKIIKDIIVNHYEKVKLFINENKGYQTNIEKCWWQRFELWYGKNPKDEENFNSFLKWIICNENIINSDDLIEKISKISLSEI